MNMAGEDLVVEAPLTDEQYEAAFNQTVEARDLGDTKSEPAPEPAPQADQDAVVAPEPNTAPAAAAATPVDPLAGLPDEVRARINRLEQDNRSMAGRVSAYQRRYEEATGKRAPAPTPTPQETAAKTEEWDSFAKQYPEIGAAIEARFKAATPQGDAATQAELVEYVQQQKRQEFLKDAWAAVDSVHPNWRKEGATQEFKTWKASSQAYEKLASSDDIADAIALFDLYEAYQGKQPTRTTPDTTAADQIAARRAKQAEGALVPDGKSASPNETLDLNDGDQLFAFYAQKANGRIKGRGH